MVFWCNSRQTVGYIAYAGLGGFLFGYDFGCINGALPVLLNETGLLGGVLTHGQAEAVVGTCKIGAALGALLAIWLLPRGHVPCFWLSGFAFVCGPVLLACAGRWEVLVVGRFIVGVAIGLSSVASPTYLADISPPSHRGCIVGLYELSLTLGMLCASLINTLLQLSWAQPLLHDVAAWRVMLGLPMVPAVPFLFGCLFLPETPATLVARGQMEAAYLLLLRLRGGVQPPPSPVRPVVSTPTTHRRRLADQHSGWAPDPCAPIHRRVPSGGSECSRSTIASNAMSRASGGSDGSPAHRGDDDVSGLLRFTTGNSSHGSFNELPLHEAASESNLTHLLSPLVERHPGESHAQARAALDALVNAHRQGGGNASSSAASPCRRLCGRERRAALLMLLLAVCNQANGSSTLLNYGSELLSSKLFRLSRPLAGLLTSLTAVIKLACVSLSALTVDRCGRRPLLLGGSLLMVASLAMGACACAAATSAPPPAYATPLVLASLLLFIGAYALSLAPLFFTLLSELFSPRTRPLAAGVATALTFASGGAADLSFLSMVDAVGYPGVFGLYAAVSAVGGLGVLLLLPETKGRTLVEVQALLERQACCARPQRECDRPTDEMEEEGGLAAMSKRSSLIIAA